MATDTQQARERDLDGVRGRFRLYGQTIKDNWFAYALLLPTLAYLVALLWYPFVRGIWMSFHSWPFLGEPEWVGIQNYVNLFRWDAFFTSIEATVIYGLAIFVQLFLALVAALVVANLDRFQNVVSGSLLVSYTMPPVVTGTVWLFLLNPSIGPVFTYLTNNNILNEAIYWTVNGDSAITVVTLVTAWTFWPFMFIIILASRQNISDEHYETARVYGASRLQTFLRITLPQLKSAILIAVSIRLIWNLSKISQPLQLTGGGPGYETSILAVLMYNLAYLDGRLGVSYAVGMVLLVLTLAFVFVFIREFNRQKEAGA
ncbi:carbohydrate ABC transporter permease [Halobellus limi]|uniref:Multiple sugar transport system permease protein n=1 Tax=Halobellus limi TaxID=699433 RepID=A0A1H6BQF7_9EURY|nr:sugar ABC transporter permease [Halobellus limi]QCC49379.1 sugar ABC transporter permease [Halobellus limi]SEG62933.1 multiple sugar transport system permease protein [Halobellus limi]